MNIYDISKKAGVSIATVSRVLNHSKHVSPATKEKVLSAILETGFVPNAFARGLGLNTMKTIGLLCPDASDLYLSRALALLEEKFRQKGYGCLLVCTGRERDELLRGVDTLAGRLVDGIILMGSSFVSRVPEENAALLGASQAIPMAVLNGLLEGPHVYSFLCDDRTATCDMVRLFTGKGRKRILYLYHSLNASGLNKRQGYRDGLAASGLAWDEALEILVPREMLRIDTVKQIVLDRLSGGLLFDSVLTSEDILAVGALKALHHTGIRVPEDMLVAGYNNSALCLCTEPELTSVDNQLSAMCDQIVLTMTGVLDGLAMAPQSVIHASCVQRASTGAPSA